MLPCPALLQRSSQTPWVCFLAGMKDGYEHMLGYQSFNKKRCSVALLVAVSLCATAVGLLTGLLLDAKAASSQHIGSTNRLQLFSQPQQPAHLHTVLSSQVWSSEAGWGRNCTGPAAHLGKGLDLLCRLPSIWKNCSGGIYLDVGTNVGAQLRKLYNPWQFPDALVLDLYTKTYGHDRSSVCALGIEANPVHTAYLTVLNAYFKRKGIQALVLTETAASVRPGHARFEQDSAGPQEWAARLATPGKGKARDHIAEVPLLDLPAFVSEVVHPLALESRWRTGKQLPLGMKIDIEGEEYAMLPALITSGGLCDMDMVYVETHPKSYATETGKAVGLKIPAIEKSFEQMRRANPRCYVQYMHLDDETYLYADTQVPLPP